VRQYYLAQADRLVSISPLQFDIQLAAKATQLAYRGASPHPFSLDPAEVTLAGQTPATTSSSDPPRQRPAFVQPQSTTAAVCAAFGAGATVPAVSVGSNVPSTGVVQTTSSSKSSTPLADRIVVPPGWAALVTVVANNGSAAGTTSLITDLGVRYSLASADVQKILGYGGVKPIRIPAGLAARIPAGPALDPATARQPN
jgi:hypothetical protein